VAALGAVAAGLTLVLALVATRGRPPGIADTRPAPWADGRTACMVVAARDVTVFTSDRGVEGWTSWPAGTRFWAATDAGPRGRLRTLLRNGRQAWVTGDRRHVHPAGGCP
jgi:hypothetical protein